jgi:hypothetical protein
MRTAIQLKGRIGAEQALAKVRSGKYGKSTFKSKGKTGNPVCSAAMSAWKMEGMTPVVASTLARCRMMVAARGPSLKQQAAQHRATKGTRSQRLADLDFKADRIYRNRQSLGRGNAARESAFDRSVSISRALYRTQQGRAVGARGRGTVARQMKAEALRAGGATSAAVATNAAKAAGWTRKRGEAWKRAIPDAEGIQPRNTAKVIHAGKVIREGTDEAIPPRPSVKRITKAHGRGTPERLKLAALQRKIRSFKSPGMHDALLKAEAANSPLSPATSPRKADGRGTPQRKAVADLLRKSRANSPRGTRAYSSKALPLAKPERTGFQLKPATHGPAPRRFENTGSGRTSFLLDMKRGDLPGQTTLMERFGTVATHPAKKPMQKAPGRGTAERLKLASLHRKIRSFKSPATRDALLKAEAAASPLSPATTPNKAEGRGTPNRARAAARIKQLRAGRITSPENLAKPGEPGYVGEVARESIHFDPQRFQYKQDVVSSQTGSVGSLAGVKKWDKELAGVIQVWKDPANGKTYVVNGHNRLDLAGKIGVDRVTARYLDAKTASEARAKGALTNIAEGRGTATDAAKFFKDTGIKKADLDARGIPLREKIADDGIALANLTPRLFRRVIDGELPQERGAIIGRAGLGETQQHALVDLIDKQKGRTITNEVLKELTDTVKSSASKASGGFDLFGDVGEQSLALHKATIQAAIKSKLSREKKLFGTVAKSKAAEDLTRGGNTIDRERSGQISAQATEGLHVFDQLKNVSGPISQRLNRAAERVDAGEPRERVIKETYDDILANIKDAYKF